MKWFRMGYYSIQDYALYIPLMAVLLWLLYRFLFSRIRLDRDFVIAALPYMLAGILVRVLADAGFFTRSQWWSITPGVYVLTILAGLGALLLGLLARRAFGIEYWLFPLLAGVCLDVALLYRLLPSLVNPSVILYPVAISACITGAVYSFSRGMEEFRRKDNLAIIFAHLLDGSASFYGIEHFGFLEEHILPRLFIDLAGNAIIMIPLKLSVALLVLYFLEKWYREEEEKDETLYRMLKFTIFILGMGPGLRNSILLSFQ